MLPLLASFTNQAEFWALIVSGAVVSSAASHYYNAGRNARSLGASGYLMAVFAFLMTRASSKAARDSLITTLSTQVGYWYIQRLRQQANLFNLQETDYVAHLVHFTSAFCFTRADSEIRSLSLSRFSGWISMVSCVCCNYSGARRSKNVLRWLVQREASVSVAESKMRRKSARSTNRVTLLILQL